MLRMLRNGIIFALVLITKSVCAQSVTSLETHKLVPNELGQVMYLMYHQIRSPEKEWIRTPDNFRRDLENLYQRGYRLAHLNDVVEGRIYTEAGRTPVCLTFDDAAFGQIDKIVVQGHEVWNPDSAVGIILEFAKRHPDMGIAGTFFINPFSAHNSKLGAARWADWMKEMVALGFEFGNHTFHHPNLKKEDPTYEMVEREIASLQAWVHQRLPGYIIHSMALPFGVYPLQTEWAVRGQYGGEIYQHNALFAVGAGPARSPFSKYFDRFHIPRVRAQDGPGSLPVSSYWISFFDHHPEMRFVSDGNPSTITIHKSNASELRQQGPVPLRVIEN